MRGGRLAAAALLLAASGFGALSQARDPFLRPPPGGQGQPTIPHVEIEALVRQGFEVKAVERASERDSSYLMILQRSGEIRSCVLRITRDQNRNPKRESVCF